MSDDAEALLSAKEQDHDHERESLERPTTRGNSERRTAKWPLYVLIFSAMVNLILVTYISVMSVRAHNKRPDVSDNTLEQPFPSTSEYGESTNFTSLDILWDEFSEYLNQGFVALDTPGLPPADNFPWDQSKQVYAINSFHLLHCLQIIYHSIRTLQTTESPDDVDLGHTIHCLGALKEEIKCKADDNLIPLNEDLFDASKGSSQVRQCRDWRQLEVFATSNSACFRDLTGQPGHLTIDEWRNCPEGSPYRQIADQYQPT